MDTMNQTRGRIQNQECQSLHFNPFPHFDNGHDARTPKNLTFGMHLVIVERQYTHTGSC